MKNGIIHLTIATFASITLAQSISVRAELLVDVCVSEESRSQVKSQGNLTLPTRKSQPVQTSGTVPHFQIGITPVIEINEELHRLAFSLPGVEKRPTIVSLPGTDGMWLSNRLPLATPQAIVAGREFAHIHPDGSLHAPLPFDRALEIANTGWGERHPWADQRDGWEGLVMLYTPQNKEELIVVFRLILDSYNYITGKNLHISVC